MNTGAVGPWIIGTCPGYISDLLSDAGASGFTSLFLVYLFFLLGKVLLWQNRLLLSFSGLVLGCSRERRGWGLKAAIFKHNPTDLTETVHMF